MKNNKIEKVWTPKEIAEELKRRGIKLKCYPSAISHKKDELKIKPIGSIGRTIVYKKEDAEKIMQAIIKGYGKQGKKNKPVTKPVEKDISIKDIQDQLQMIVDEQNLINANLFTRHKDIDEKFTEQDKEIKAIQNQMADILNEIEAIKKELKNKKNKLFRG